MCYHKLVQTASRAGTTNTSCISHIAEGKRYKSRGSVLLNLGDRYLCLYEAVLEWATRNGLLRNASSPNAPAPPAATVLIHTRLGDVIDRSPYSVDDIFEHDTCYRRKQYVKSVRYHTEIARSLRELDIHEVQMVGSLEHGAQRQHGSARTKSLQYLIKLERWYRSQGFRVRQLPL
mmetsp:Transcript_5818/g.21218  ORF Transcript_5818/g.21218 Transcript_5818/m.21218 type:complete len:176 (+) Transcript_5818:657-1184(+)